jgi:hypothetical protein
MPSSVSLDYTGTNVTIVPGAVLPSNTRIKITVAGVQDLAGQNVIPQSAAFTTGTGPDTNPATVLSTNVDGANNSNVPVGSG